MAIKLENIICLIILVLTFESSLSQTKANNEPISDRSLTEYQNKKFRITASIPNEWYVYKEEEKGRKKLLIEWGLPKVYDSILNLEIENAVYIKAFRAKSIKSTEDMILSSYLNIAGTSTALSLEPNISKDSRILYVDSSNGSKYKGKVYFKYENNIGYRITFMATPGTYEQNLKYYEEFIASLEFD